MNIKDIKICPDEFTRIQQDITFVGITFLPSKADMLRVANMTRKRYDIKVRTAILKERAVFPERYLIMLPEEAPEAVKEYVLTEASSYN